MDKYDRLKDIFRRMGSAVIAYSGGVDSSLLIRAAQDALGAEPGRVLAVTARSSTYPRSELEAAERLAAEIGIPHRIIDSEELDIPGFAENPTDRCYYCKGELFTILKQLADKEGYAAVCDGNNLDDTGDYRPGRKAAEEAGVRSPLIEAEMRKEDVRRCAKEAGLPNWDKPAAACLASRFPYGTPITAEKLGRVEKAEEILKAAGYLNLRVRDHEGIARIELAPEDIAGFTGRGDMPDLVRAVKGCGFDYVTLDLQGYRTGSLNEVLGRDI